MIINVYEKFTITNMHVLYLYLLNSQEIWWLKLESPLAPICSFCRWECDASSWKCMHSDLAIAISLLWERMYSLIISLLICWSDALDWAGRLSINNQLPHCFCRSLLLNLAFRIWIYSARISEVWREKVAEMNQICLSSIFNKINCYSPSR